MAEIVLTEAQVHAWALDCAERVVHLAGEHRALCELAIQVSRWCLAGAPLEGAQQALRELAWEAARVALSSRGGATYACASAASLPNAARRHALDAAEAADTEASWAEGQVLRRAEEAQQQARGAEYEAGAAHVPTARPTRHRLKPLLLHVDKAVREDAVRCLAWIREREATRS